MSSLFDLNSFGARKIPFIDKRVFNLVTSPNMEGKRISEITIVEDAIHSPPFAFDITEFRGIGKANFSINVSDSGATVIYDEVMPEIQVVTMGKSTTFSFTSLEQWHNIKNHVKIKPQVDRTETYEYAMSINWTPGNKSEPTIKSWAVITHIIDTPELSTPETCHSDVLCNHTPRIVDIGNTGNFTLQISFDTEVDATLSTLESSGAAAWSDFHNTYSIIGTREQINAHLKTLRIEYAGDPTDVTLEYKLISPSSLITTVRQELEIGNQ